MKQNSFRGGISGKSGLDCSRQGYYAVQIAMSLLCYFRRKGDFATNTITQREIFHVYSLL